MRNILILAGVHGNEKSAQLLAIHLANADIEIQNVNVKIIPVVNPTGSLDNVRNYVDKSSADLNRIQTYDSQADIRTMILDEIDKCDLLIDIHNSPSCGNFCLFDNIYDYHLEVAILKKFKVEYAYWDSKSYVNKSYAKDKGKLAITYEFNGMIADTGREFRKATKDLINIIEAFDYIEESDDYPNVFEENKQIKTLYSKYAGFAEYYRPVNSIVEEGDIVCTIYLSEHEYKKTIDIAAPCKLKVMGYENELIVAGSSIMIYIKE